MEDEGVGDVEFFEEEGDAFALADLEVVDCELGGWGRHCKVLVPRCVDGWV